MHPSNRLRTRSTILIWLGILSVVLAACGGTPQPKSYTIGVVNYFPPISIVYDGFKAGMTELHYVEGKNVTYLYDGIVQPDGPAIDSEINSLLAKKADVLFTLGTPTTLGAKRGVVGTDIPVVFAPVLNPVMEGVVENNRHPEGNLTGIQTGTTIPKSVEWLRKLVPGLKKVYVPYNPADEVSVTSIASLREVESTLGIELVFGEVSTPEAAIAAIKALPADVKGMYLVPVPSLEPDISGIIKTATDKGIAVGAYIPTDLEAGALVSDSPDFFAIGKQAARFVDQILKGTKPADLPVETAESFLRINLKTAKALGLDIPDAILAQAHTIIR